MRLELGEWLTEIGWVLSIAGVVSIESPLAHVQDRTYADRPFKSLNSYGLHSRN